MLVTLLIPGRRAATMVASLVTGAATLIFFATLFVDLTSLPPIIKVALYAIPYTHTALAILSYALGNTITAFLHTMLVAGLTVVAIYAAASLYRPDRLVKRW